MPSVLLEVASGYRTARAFSANWTCSAGSSTRCSMRSMEGSHSGARSPEGTDRRPDKGQAIAKSLELRIELPTPESANLSGAHHYEHLPGLGQHLQHVVHELREIVDGRDGGLVLDNGGVLKVGRCSLFKSQD